ncbi:DUF4260 family protein [Maritimibacter sp. DP1N21-5]|uniref:DUF4260 family protein n=1 Tax=Maritimibacter sp. DP1N21-5 TaxID=2836867 RepID=UPI001C43F123|nr:DUF4260 family protein [Maritimibacter sp. DP1N21-5]MBV7409323.1 DUF4260 domain-containing protein [Maritimibacter sp. DP1N21-5]
MTHGTRQPLDRPQILHLRTEGLALLSLGLALFIRTEASWWLFAALILAPDLSGLGYLAGKRAGAGLYNAAHSIVGPVALVLLGWSTTAPLALALAAIWVVHIGVDRVVGYGFKSETDHRSTHVSF